jgi:hypothetical protein
MFILAEPFQLWQIFGTRQPQMDRQFERHSLLRLN